MGLDLLQFRTNIIRPALTAINLWSESAENLLLGTAMVESGLRFITQNQGPAVSVMQIEPATYTDLRKRLIEEHPNIHGLMKQYLCMYILPVEPDYLESNLAAAVMFARLKYYLSPDALPDANDYVAMAEYHKKIYNTNLGATKQDKSKFIFKAAINNNAYPY